MLVVALQNPVSDCVGDEVSYFTMFGTSSSSRWSLTVMTLSLFFITLDQFEGRNASLAANRITAEHLHEDAGLPRPMCSPALPSIAQ
mmetsp:Transcript_12118/g.21043  ORF Transcript_12118/g.21043 Transcript_12118/m.21043 type:complete len:87 (-) Transcript_12118:413-673(-)